MALSGRQGGTPSLTQPLMLGIFPRTRSDRNNMIKAKVIGAGGYGGVGITELLIQHPEAKLVALVDVENVGQPISKSPA